MKRLRMFNPAPRSIGRLTWLPVKVGGKLNPELRAKMTDASGVYAIRRRDSGGVVYVGESSHGSLWRTAIRHFYWPPAGRRDKRGRPAQEVWATDKPEDYEIAVRVTSRGARPKSAGAAPDPKALSLQARWIAYFTAKGAKLGNVDDGLAERDPWDPEPAVSYASDEEDDLSSYLRREGVINPSSPLTTLGLLVRLVVAEGQKTRDLRWSLRSAPLLAYDKRRRLFIVYRGRVVRPALAAEAREYKRTHWGRAPAGRVLSGGMAVPPWKPLGRAVLVAYATQKGGDRELVDYVHEFGDEGGKRSPPGWRPPRVVEHACDGCGPKCAAAGALALQGGTYRLDTRGIVG